MAGTHDFDAWDGDIPPGSRGATQVQVHAEREEEQVDNVTVRKVHTRHDHTSAGASKIDDNADKISVVSDVTPPPPPTTSGLPSGLNPFTPEWFAQVIGAAATAAVTAMAQAPPRALPAVPNVNPAAPRRLNDRKVPDFWEDRPEFWFRIFDAHLSHFNPSESQCFDALLPLLTPAARATVHSASERLNL